MLLTRAEAEAAVGEALPSSVDDVTLGMCQWTSVDFSASANVALLDWQQNLLQGDDKPRVPVSGVGDEAFYVGPAYDPVLFVHARAAARVGTNGLATDGFEVYVSGPNFEHAGDQGLAKCEALALEILANF